MTTTTGNATSLITFSRGTLATVTDSDGKIKWAPHNLFRASEQFDSASWDVKSGTTITANNVVAPNGTTTADTIAFTSSGSHSQRYFNGIALTGVTLTFGVWLWSATGKATIVMRLNGQATGSDQATKLVNLTTTPTYHTVTRTFTSSDTAADAGLDNRTVVGGDGIAGNVIAWGAHLYRSDLGGMQANASAYPYYNPSTRKNLLGFTELLTTGWTNTNTTDSQVAVAAPNGSASSIEVTATAGNGTLLASVALLASPYTFSIWLKRKTGTGTVEITVDGTTYVTAAVTSEWQRFSTTLTPSAGTKTPGIRLVTSGDAVYAWGAQLSDSASLDPYVPNFGAAPSAAAAHGPRLDYDPVTLAAKGLLVEQQSTNLCLRSEEFDNASWTKADLTVTANSAIAPSGVQTADTLAATAGNATIKQGVTTTAVAFTFSIYLKRKTGTGNVDITMDGTTWVTQTINSSTWTRCIVTQTGVAGTSNPGVRIVTSGDEVYAWGAQAE